MAGPLRDSRWGATVADLAFDAWLYSGDYA